MPMRPNRFDIIFVAEYALKMIIAMPETTKEIKLSGDILYAYYYVHNEIANSETPLLTYEAYTDFCESINKSINLTDNEISSEERVNKCECIEFNQFFENFWYANRNINVSGAIMVDLSRFKELECL